MKPGRPPRTVGRPLLPIAMRTFPLYPDVIFGRRKIKRKHSKEKRAASVRVLN